MHQPLNSTALPAAAAEPDGPDADPLLALAGPLANSHALILGEGSPDLLCGLLRRGCLAATLLRPAQKPEADRYDLVLVPRVCRADQVERVVSDTRRALVATGRVVIRIGSDPAGRLSRALKRSLQLNGFIVARSRGFLGMTVLLAHLRPRAVRAPHMAQPA